MQLKLKNAKGNEVDNNINWVNGSTKRFLEGWLRGFNLTHQLYKTI